MTRPPATPAVPGPATLSVPGPAGTATPTGTGRRPRRRTRAVALAIGGVLAIGSIAWGCLTVVALVSRRDAAFDRHLTLPSPRVAVTARDIAVSVVGDGAAGRVDVHTTVSWSFEKPRLTTSVGPDGTARVSFDCAGWSPVGCSGRITVHVPRDVAVTASSSDGAVSVDGLRGTVSAHSSSGAVTVQHVVGRVTATASDGRITVADVTGDVEARTLSGAVHGDRLRSATARTSSSDGTVRLSFAEPPTNVRATSGSGSVRVEVPAGSGPYAVDASSSDGGAHNGVRTDPRSARLIYVHSGDGGVRVTYPSP